MILLSGMRTLRRVLSSFLCAVAFVVVMITGVMAEEKAQQPALVLVHDWFGDSPFYRDFANDFESAGYHVTRTDLYNGAEGATTHAQAWELLQQLTDEHAATAIDQAVASASDESGRVILIGFSAGAIHAVKAATRNAESVVGTVIFYGDAITDTDALAQLGGPVLAIYGSKDGTYGDKSAAETAAEFSMAADEAGAKAEIHIYPGAHHAFAQPLFNAGSTYDPVAAASASLLAKEFITRISADNGKAKE